MKLKIIIATLIFMISLGKLSAQIQPDPAHWAYALKKLSGNNYEVLLQCTIDDGWHIYAQKQGDMFVGTKTRIELAKASGLTIIGTPTETGRKDVFFDKPSGMTNNELSGKVVFMQKVRLEPGIKEIKGTVTYQTCTHKQCLAEKTINFTIPVNQ